LSLVPTLEATVGNERGSREVNFLVDTGAAYTIIPLGSVAALLEDLPQQTALRQVGGNAQDMSGNPLMGFRIKLKIGISQACSYDEPDVWLVPEAAWAVLGAKNFFYRHGLIVWNWPGCAKGRRFSIFQRRRY